MAERSNESKQQIFTVPLGKPCYYIHEIQTHMKLNLFAASLAAGVSLLGATSSLAFGLPGGLKLTAPTGGGGGTNALTEQAKVRTVNAIFKEVSSSAFENGKLLIAKQKWACDKITKAQGILKAIKKEDLSAKAGELRERLFCDWTAPIPPSMLAKKNKKIDPQEL